MVFRTRLCDTKPGTKANYYSIRRPNFDARANGGDKPSATASSHTFNAPKPPSRPTLLNHVMCELAGIAVQTPICQMHALKMFSKLSSAPRAASIIHAM